MGFWDFMFRSRPVNDSSVNKIVTPGVPSFEEDFKDTEFPEEFSEEFASEFHTDHEINTDNSYSENGVSLKETTNVFGLTYDGILARDGAQVVYAVIGMGDNRSWHDVKYYPMQKTDEHAFEVLFPARGAENFNVAFKDGANHWDNNSGHNYTYVNEGG
jgi:hypothetical protein